jgi:hypothetical protein
LKKARVIKELNTVNEPKDIQKRENSVQRSEAKPEAKRKPKRPRVSQRKELAVVTFGMVAAITSFGGLLAANQAQSEQAAGTVPAAQVSSPDLGSEEAQSTDTAPTAQASSPAPGSPSSKQPPKDEAPVYSPAPQEDAPAKAPHAQSQGS